MKRKQRGKRQKGCSVWKVLQESQIGNRRRKRQNEGERERRGEEFWLGRKWSTEGGIEVWRGFLLVALSPDWCLLFSARPLFTVLPAQLLSGLGSELQWDWNNACVTFVFITLSYMHKNTHTDTLWGSLMAIFSHCIALLEAFDHLSVLAQWLNKSPPLTLSCCLFWVSVCVCLRANSVFWVSSLQQPVTHKEWKTCLPLCCLCWNATLISRNTTHPVWSAKKKNLVYNGFFMSSAFLKCFCVLSMVWLL